jgi:hypothetical protein
MKTIGYLGQLDLTRPDKSVTEEPFDQRHRSWFEVSA